MPRFLVVCLNPTFQRTVTLDHLECGEVNRGTAARLDASGKGVNTARVLVAGGFGSSPDASGTGAGSAPRFMPGG